jgi:hypothetical protein
MARMKRPALWRLGAAAAALVIPLLAVGLPRPAFAVLLGSGFAFAWWIASPRTSAAMRGGAKRHFVAVFISIGVAAAFAVWATEWMFSVAEEAWFDGWSKSQTIAVLSLAMLGVLATYVIILWRVPPFQTLMRDFNNAQLLAQSESPPSGPGDDPQIRESGK